MRSFTNHKVAHRIAKRFATRNMTAKVAIGRPGPPNDHTDPTVPTSATLLRVLYRGPARLYSVSGGSQSDFADGLVFMSSSYISIPVDACHWTQVNDIIEVLDHHDADMIGRCFRVMDVDGGGQFPVARRHTVTSVQRSEQWTWPAEVH